MRKRAIKIFAVAFFALVLFSANRVLAAEFFFYTDPLEVSAEQVFDVSIFIDTARDNINAIEGEIEYPSDLLEVTNINDGNSIINLWVDKPTTHAGKIVFSGIIPGGYNYDHGLIFTVSFLAVKESAATIRFNAVNALLNDGLGTKAAVESSDISIAIAKPLAPGLAPLPPKTDSEPPETFVPQIASDPSIFEGQWFLVFAAQDKGSGIARYEVCEGKRKCVIVDSPYVLRDQGLDRDITVQAVDKSGNIRSAFVPARQARPWYKEYAIPAIIMVIAFSILLFTALWRVRARSNS